MRARRWNGRRAGQAPEAPVPFLTAACWQRKHDECAGKSAAGQRCDCPCHVRMPGDA